MPCIDPPSFSIRFHIISLSNLCFLKIFLSVGFFLMKVPLADCSVKTLAAHGSIPGLTFPLSLELLTVGAIARKWVLRKPVPTHQRGSPKVSARAREALSDSILI